MTRKLQNIPRGTWKVFLAIVLVGLLTLLPAGNNPVEAHECSAYHLVQPGQNLYRISLAHRTSMAAIAAANGISNYNVIYAGQYLCIPPIIATPTIPTTPVIPTIPSNVGVGGVPGTVVNCTFLNLRNGPAMIYGVLDVYPQGTPMMVLGRNYYSTWMQVQTPTGQIGWVNGSFMYTGIPIYNLPIIAG